jgi:hypothetical protein
MKILISGEAHGSETDHYRWVAYLSKEAKEMIKDGTGLVICERPFNDHLGAWYVVTETDCRYYHRLPTKDEERQIILEFL